MILTACGSGCKTGDTKEQCRARSPIEEPMKQFGETTDEAMQKANEAITNEVNQRKEAMPAYDAQQNEYIQKVDNNYTSWVTQFAESIFGPPDP